MQIDIGFPGGSKVEAAWGDMQVMTDQPAASGGDNSAPSPFELFLASFGTCAGFYVLNYCRKHDLPSEGIHLIEQIHTDPQTGLADQLGIEIRVPASFPESHYAALIRSAELCKVKKNIEHPPVFSVTARAEG
jgi:ribosomal protein S12 methylthiotransferase accessory factor